MRLRLHLLLAIVILLAACGSVAQRAVPFDAACARADWAEASRLAPDDWRDPDNGLDAASRAALGWRIAQAQAAAGRLVEASSTWRLVAAASGDPDALWEGARVSQRMSYDDHAAQIALTRSRLRADEDADRFSDLGFLEGQVARHLAGELTAGRLGDHVSSLYLQGHHDEAFMCGLLASDLHALETSDHLGAAKIAQIVEEVSRSGPFHSQACLRQAKLYMQLGRWMDASRKMALVKDEHLARPGNPLPALREQLAAGVATVIPESPKAPPPPELAWRTAVEAALAGIDPVSVSDGGRRYAGPGWRLELGRDALVFTAADALSLAASAGASITVTAAPATTGWDAERQASIVSGPSGLGAVLFANGDVFFGSYLFLGRGLYLSPGRPPSIETCRFGMPMVRAQAITSVLDSAAVGASRLVRARLGDGGIYHGWLTGGEGSATMVGPVFIDYPGLGFFLGSFNPSGVEDGGFLRDDGRREVIFAGTLIGCPAPDGTMAGVGILPGDQLLTFESGGTMLYFDALTGYELWYDRDSRYHHRKLNAWRVAAIAERKRLAEEQRSREERWAEERRREEAQRAEAERERARERAAWEAENPNWRREEAEEKMRAELAAVRANTAFQFMPEETSSSCIRCGGAGYMYAPGGTQQNGTVWVPDQMNSNSGSWRSGTVRTTASVVECHWCGGSGRR